MKNFCKVLSIIICMVICLSTVSCGGSKKNSENISQTAYNTIFQSQTTVPPNTTATQADSSSTTGVAVTVPDITRTGKRVYYPQNKAMRSITSAQLLGEINLGINIGNSLDSYGFGENGSVADYELFSKNPIITHELITAYYTAGFRAVRIPVSFAEHFNGDYSVNDEWLDRIAEVADMVMDMDMYCIITSKNDGSWLVTDDSKFTQTKNQFTAMWKSIANRFKSYNDHVLFEGFDDLSFSNNNSSTPTATDFNNANKLNQAFVNTVRATGGNNSKRHLVVATYASGLDSTILDGFKVPNDTAKNKLIMEFNCFLPSKFCLDSSTSAIWGTNEEKAYLKSVLRSVYEKAKALKIPCIIGEFGAVHKGHDSVRGIYASYFLETAYNLNMVAFWWDDGASYKLFDRSSARVLNSTLITKMITAAS